MRQRGWEDPIIPEAKKFRPVRRVAYAEATDQRVLRAVQTVVDQGLARPVLIGAAAAALSLLLFGSDNMLIPAMALIAVVLTLLRKREVPADG